MTGKRKNLAYYKNLAAKHARSARTSQMKAKTLEKGIEIGIKLAKEAQR